MLGTKKEEVKVSPLQVEAKKVQAALDGFVQYAAKSNADLNDIREQLALAGVKESALPIVQRIALVRGRLANYHEGMVPVKFSAYRGAETR